VLPCYHLIKSPLVGCDNYGIPSFGGVVSPVISGVFLEDACCRRPQSWRSTLFSVRHRRCASPGESQPHKQGIARRLGYERESGRRWVVVRMMTKAIPKDGTSNPLMSETTDRETLGFCPHPGRFLGFRRPPLQAECC